MAAMSSLARPYAQAVFELAKQSKDYKTWSDALAFMAALLRDDSVQALINNPRVEREQVSKLFEELCADRVPESGRNLLRLMIINNRLMAMQDVADQYEAMRAEEEGTVDARVLSAKKITNEQKTRLSKALEKRLGRKVNLTVQEDASLLGGAVIRAGDLVIDGSARGRLEKLASVLQR